MALIPGGPLVQVVKGHNRPGNERRHEHHHDGQAQPGPEAELVVAVVEGDETSESSNGSPQTAAAQPQHGPLVGGESGRALGVSEGLGAPGLLGEAIIPLSALHAPQLQHPQQPPQIVSAHQPAAAPIKTASPTPSRAPIGGDPLAPAAAVVDTTPPNMIFADLYKSPRSTFSKFRNPFPHTAPLPADIDADLVSRDKVKQKEAVKKYLAEKIRNDWEFTWPPVAESPSAPAPEKVAAEGEEQDIEVTPVPPAVEEEAPRDPGEEADSESDAESVYSTISEDATRFRPRADWTSDLSDDDEPIPSASPFRFDTPDAIGAAVRDSIRTKRTRRRRAVRAETKWNPGLACFEARRDLWTGAKTVRVKPKPASPVSPSSGRRLSFWRHHRTHSTVSHSGTTSSGSPPGPMSPLQPTATRNSTTTASLSDSGKSGTGAVQRTSSQDSTSPVLYPVQTPSMYGSLYDKVVSQSLQPSCPVNLGDMLRACVVGWKRDGEWPPRSSYPAPAPVPAPSAAVVAIRQRKAAQQLKQQQLKQAQQQQQQQRKNSVPSAAPTGRG
ncbi:hypothetical protein N0V88_000214 [Collariella sp. IMI 366227]|nr:hypothetical protein N0V88_000214 [Collariella sp. IMI 366227]